MEAFAEFYINASEPSRGIAEGESTISAPRRSPFPPEGQGEGLVRVLLVGCGQELQQQLRLRLFEPHWELRVVASGAAALACLHQEKCGMVLVADALPDLDSAEFQQLVKARFPAVQVLELKDFVLSPPANGALNATDRLRSFDQLPSPIPQCRNVPHASSRPVPVVEWEGMVGASSAMQRVFRTAALVARRNTTVLIGGESGTGKDLLAKAIHNSSLRSRQPYVVINCAAIPEALLEAELFGYTKGAFTGAMQSRNGRVHAAHGGTLFLDEIGDMPLPLQSKILRFLEQGEVQRIGSTDTLTVDCRVIAATNVNLQAQVQARQFREDLYYRLSVLPITVPPLRDRMSDIPALCYRFLERFCPGTTLCADALDLLMQHHWPGNIRELRNVMERASVFAEGRPVLEAEDVVL